MLYCFTIHHSSSFKKTLARLSVPGMLDTRYPISVQAPGFYIFWAEMDSCIGILGPTTCCSSTWTHRKIVPLKEIDYGFGYIIMRSSLLNPELGLWIPVCRVCGSFPRFGGTPFGGYRGYRGVYRV